jgi:predicted O-methyltransferase YrrM
MARSDNILSSLRNDANIHARYPIAPHPSRPPPDSGRLIGSEFEPSKVARARAHLDAAGLADLVEIREGDALETLRDVGGEVDLLLIDGAFSLYLPVLRLVEPALRPGAIILGENAFDPAYLAYVRDPANGYLSQAVLDAGRGNEFTVRVG